MSGSNPARPTLLSKVNNIRNRGTLWQCEILFLEWVLSQRDRERGAGENLQISS